MLRTVDGDGDALGALVDKIGAHGNHRIVVGHADLAAGITQRIVLVLVAVVIVADADSRAITEKPRGNSPRFIFSKYML